MNKFILSLPLIFFLIISAFVLVYLIEKNEPGKPPSALINKEIPNFLIKSLYNENIYLSSNNIKKNVNVSSDENINLFEDNLENKYTLINFFASWCAPCKIEHHLFFKIKKQYPNLFLLGINHKDKINNAIEYLDREGNPYSFVGLDNDGSVSLEFGVFGLPETFLINESGRIIYKHMGPLTKKIINDEIKPLLQ